MDRISNSHEKINCALAVRALSPIHAGPGSVRCFMPGSEAELAGLLPALSDPVVLGGCTNLLLGDFMADYPKFVSLRQMHSILSDPPYFRAQAGALLSELIRAALPFSAAPAPLSGIPGTVGGALNGNAGAFGAAIGDFVKSVTCMDSSGKSLSIPASGCGFAYRESIFRKNRNLIIVSAEFCFPPSAGGEERAKEILAIRRKNGLYEQPSLGSFFKNPGNDFAGRLIESAGLKGFRIGDAAVSTRHANIIVNLGNATASDIAEVAKTCKETVSKLYNITLEPEVIPYGFDI